MTATIILAAGASTRLGEPKQRLLFGGKTLLQRAVQAAEKSDSETTIVVTGAYSESILADMEEEKVCLIHNPDWREGMASSIRVGLEQLLRIAPQTTAVIIMLCDQPFADGALLNRLIEEKHKTGKGIIVCAYKNTAGVPVLFDKIFFHELMALSGREGAKKLLFRHPEELTPIPFPFGAIDIDTPADYQALLQQNAISKD